MGWAGDAGAADCALAAATTREAVADSSGNQPTMTSNATVAHTSAIRGLRFIGHLFINQNATTPSRNHETTKPRKRPFLSSVAVLLSLRVLRFRVFVFSRLSCFRVSAFSWFRGFVVSCLEIERDAGSQCARRQNVRDLSEGRSRDVGHRSDGVRIRDVEHVEAEIQRSPRKVQLLRDARVEGRLMPLLLRSERLETDRLLGELTGRRAAGVGGAEHVGSLAETAVDELDDGADQKIMRQVVIAVHLEVPAPRFIEREELVVGTRWDADEPPVILRRRVGGQQRPASRKSSAE